MTTPLDAARDLNIINEKGENMPGTIEEAEVLATLTAMSDSDPDNVLLYQDAADKVRALRSAGVETIDDNSVFAARRESTQIQMRYRGEVADILLNLAIDLALGGGGMEPAAV